MMNEAGLIKGHWEDDARVKAAAALPAAPSPRSPAQVRSRATLAASMPVQKSLRKSGSANVGTITVFFVTPCPKPLLLCVGHRTDNDPSPWYWPCLQPALWGRATAGGDYDEDLPRFGGAFSLVVGGSAEHNAMTEVPAAQAHPALDFLILNSGSAAGRAGRGPRSALDSSTTRTREPWSSG
jgi:hypothetical protein